MKELALAVVAKKMGQETVAKAIGCGQTAISRAIKEGRDVRVRMQRGTIHSAYELKSFPNRCAEQEAAQA